MKEGSLMRVLFCKIKCPFICFCKPSAAHIYTSRPLPLKLENAPQSHVVPSAAVCNASDDKPSYGIKEESVNGNQQLKSSIRKLPNGTDATKEVGKKKTVQWTDNLGKQLAEIKEFESSETGDADNEEESSRCLCVNL
ncbi:hypothetical protein CDL12_08693 [Handroanthus impetiginosus]|uniref:Uncharacterized protein n=1 Tax=Handroanthus impetiginosus TaxID=429701 RepID=A0A2G9HMG9_9LAMI|nr:hypothetical protein CDL12_08693 [Handroanthus impetiginosus]